MATQVKDRPTGKNDAFIEAQLARAENRIRLVDLLSAVLGLLAGTLAFAVLMVFLDKRFILSGGTRQFALLAYLAAAGVYLALAILRPLRWRVNPHYAARQLEGTLPGTRNHVINWLDLHGEKVPAVLKSTLGQRAAKDLARVDVETAISNRRALMVGGFTGFFAVVFIALFFLYGPSPFASLFGRAFAPFGAGDIASRTQVVVLRPQDTTVTIGNAVTIVAQVSGRVPDARDKDAPCLLYRHDENEPYRKRYLQADESNQEWATTISPTDVENRIFYKVAAGDAETPVYRVDVRATPNIRDFEAKYHYRPYVGKADRTRTTRKLEDLRGTEVVITAWTNRPIKEGRLEFDGSDGVGDLIRTERIDNEEQVLRFRLVLDRAGKYRIRFTSIEGETYIDPIAFDVAVLPDLPPRVRLTEPAKDVTLPANGQLALKGEASDDIGIASLALHLQVVGGARLREKPYLADKLGKPGFGTPRALDYLDLLELASLKQPNGKPVELKPGMEIEYWLEAGDACDYLHPNVTSSQPRYKIKIGESEKDDAQQQKKREEDRAKQKENEKKQTEQMKKEQEEREKKKAEEQKQEKDAEKERARGRQGERDPKSKDTTDTKSEKNNEPKPGKSGESPEEKANAEKTQAEADKLKDALKNKEEKSKSKDKQDKPGEARDDGNRPGKGKDKPENKPSDADGKDRKPGESRGEGGQDSKNPAGSKKENNGKPGEQGSARGENRPEAGSPKGEGKESANESEAGKKPGECKDCPAPKSGPGQAKGAGKGDPSKVAGQRKPEGDVKPGERTKQGEGRDSGSASKPADSKPGECKDGGNPGPAGAKGQSKGGSAKTGTSKPGPGAKGQTSAGQDKPASDAGDSMAKPGEKKGDGNEGSGSKGENANKPGQDKPAPSERGAGEKGEKKPGEGAGEKGSASGKDDKTTEPGNKGTSKSAGPNKSQGDGPLKEGDPPGKGKEPGSGAGKKPGTDSSGERKRSEGSDNGSELKSEPERPAEHRASMLQLEEFRKKVDKNILKDMKMSSQQFAKFLKDYEELAKRQQKDPSETPEAIARPQAGGTLPNIASRPSSKTGKGKNDAIRNEGRSLPPPGYRESYKEFLQKLEILPPEGK